MPVRIRLGMGSGLRGRGCSGSLFEIFQPNDGINPVNDSSSNELRGVDNITIDGNAGTGVAENMMSGKVHVKGNASQSAGATAHGGLLIIDGDASSRCGISMKGVDIVVKGSVGHMSGFMSQAGNLVVCGDAGEALGDSLYETNIYIKGKVKSLGADCVEKKMDKKHIKKLKLLLQEANIKNQKAESFKRYGSAKKLYNFKIDNISNY